MTPDDRPYDVAVLGAGLMGVGIALELARSGMRVALIDQDRRPLNRASLRNEGKIHLGLIYANEPSQETALLQLDGALAFRRTLTRWLGKRVDRVECSTPFWYLVAHDSVLTHEALSAHYEAVSAAYRTRRAEDPSLDYLGTVPERLARTASASELASFTTVGSVASGFETAELAVDTQQLAHVLRDAVAESPQIAFLGGRRVTGVHRSPHGFVVESDAESRAATLSAEQVVNALWENRRAVDRTMGVTSEPGWLYRMKYRVIVQLPARLRGKPSVTMVLGRYGDVVVRPDGTAYLSWYPAGLRGWSHDLTPPATWDGPCRGEPDPLEAESVASATLSAIDAWYPGIADSRRLIVDAGVIVAYGRTDVDDAASQLHSRTTVGTMSVDGYHSVDPGKLTTAPLFAVRAADRVLARCRGVALV